MLMSHSFVDLLFILLCSTIVLLSESIHIGQVEVAPARIGGGAVAEIAADDVRLVVVDDDAYLLDEQRFADATGLVDALAPGDVAVLVTASDQVSHHRVMRAWSELHTLGQVVKLGAQPTDPPQEPDTHES